MPSSAAIKRYLRGTHRLISPAETLAGVRPLLRRAGITRVANVTGLDSIGLPVVMVCRPNARSLSISQGKGLTLAAAEASGVMESLESFHAENILLPLKLASYAELLVHHRVVDPFALPRPATSVFHPDKRLLWVEGRDLLQDEYVWLPYELVHGDYTLPYPTGSGCFAMTSNGLASGNDPREAISHALCEVVERDAERLWEVAGHAAQERCRIDRGSIDDEDCRAVLAQFDRAGVVVALWDITSDIGLPVFYCLIGARAEDPLRPLGVASGMACHPDRAIAALRAMTEAAQSRLTQIVGSRDDIDRAVYHTDVQARNRGRLGGSAGRSFSLAPSRCTETFDEDLAWELDRLHAVGIERVIVVDLSRPDFGLSVVRVVIPGLEGPAVVPDLLLGKRAEAWLDRAL
jgi:ribosomal protein S12 methylthiotransferase accessory factor